MSVPLLDVNAQNLPLAEELEAVFSRVLRSGRFIFGDELEAFEKECAAMLHVKHALSVSSGTDALLLALMGLGIGVGDEVLCPAFTFFATAGSIARLGAVPVFCDVHADSFNIDVADARKRITAKTKAIMPVHLFGQCVNMDDVKALAAEKNLLVIEDCAQAIGATFLGQQAGTMSDVGAFSFFPSKNLGGFGDGGLVSTNDDALAKRMIELRNHGMSPKYYHKVIGGNFRLDALQCALLRVKLPHYPSYLTRRNANAEFYLNELKNVAGITLPSVSENCGHTWNQFTLRVHDGKRDALHQYLTKNQIGSEIYYPVPLHQQECFSHLPKASCPVADQLASEVLSIPIYPELSDTQKTEVAEAIKNFFN